MSGEIKRILITVKTYPHPSISYKETVCTAGIDLDKYRWMRIYPVTFRYLSYEKQYPKWSIITAKVRKNEKDYRPESYKIVDLDSLQVGETIEDWGLKKEIVKRAGVHEMCSLIERSQKEISLATVKPFRILDIDYEETERTWGSKYEAVLRQQNLFDEKNGKVLEKIPYDFYYSFECRKGCRGHKMKITDWEILELFRKLRVTEGEEAALQKTIEKLEVLAEKRDLYFFVGTVYRVKAWIIIGLFYPPLTQETLYLFDLNNMISLLSPKSFKK